MTSIKRSYYFALAGILAGCAIIFAGNAWVNNDLRGPNPRDFDFGAAMVLLLGYAIAGSAAMYLLYLAISLLMRQLRRHG